jgi:hypothetical protein
MGVPISARWIRLSGFVIFSAAFVLWGLVFMIFWLMSTSRLDAPLVLSLLAFGVAGAILSAGLIAEFMPERMAVWLGIEQPANPVHHHLRSRGPHP